MKTPITAPSRTRLSLVRSLFGSLLVLALLLLVCGFSDCGTTEFDCSCVDSQTGSATGGGLYCAGDVFEAEEMAKDDCSSMCICGCFETGDSC